MALKMFPWMHEDYQVTRCMNSMY